MSKYRYISALLAMLCSAFTAAANDWLIDIDNFDESNWTDETMVYIKVISDGESVGGYSILAYIDDELRGYASQPRKLQGPPVSYIYSLRVKGEAGDKGKPIRLKVANIASEYMFGDDEYTVGGDVCWTGASEYYPSNPLIITIMGVVNVQSIKVETFGEEFCRHLKDYSNPVDLSECYTIYPDNATNKAVIMTLEPGYESQGTLVPRKGKWVFIPSDKCKGDIHIQITSADNPDCSGLHILKCHVAVEEIVINEDANTDLEIFDIIWLNDYYSIYPDDADEPDIDILYNDGECNVEYDFGSDIITFQPTVQGAITLDLKANDGYGASASLTFNVKGVLNFFDIKESCADDLLDGDGKIAKRRQSPRNVRTFTVRPMPEGCLFDPVLLECTVKSMCPEIPESWTEYACDLVEWDDTKSVYSFTPMVPGQFTISFTYDGRPLKSEDYEYISVCNVPVDLGYKLTPGWNWVGALVDSDGTMLSDVLADKNALVEARTINNLLLNDETKGYSLGFKDESGRYIHDFVFDRKVDSGHFRICLRGDIDDIDCRIYPTGNYDLLKGRWVLNPGWNWVANPFVYDLPLSAISGRLYRFTEGDVIKSPNGMATLADGEWTGSLKELKPGEACAVYCSKALSIDFDFKTYTQPAVGGSDDESGYYMAPARHTADVMGIIAYIDGLDQSLDHTIRAYVGDEYRGMGRLVNGHWFITVNADDDEIVTLKLIDTNTRETTDIAQQIAFASMAGTYNKPLKLSLANNDIRVSEGTVTGDFDGIYDLQGRDVTATNGNLAPGVYVVRHHGCATKITIR